MKKFICAFIALSVLLALFAGCGQSQQPAQGAESTGAADTSEKAPVALIVTSAFGDAGTSDDMNAGLTRAAEEFGITVTPYEALEAGVYEEVIRSFAQEGYGLIMATYSMTSGALDKVAADFPDVQFVNIYSAGHEFENQNVTAYDFACWESNYVCGVLAGLVSETGMLGHIIGGEDSNITANYNAFVKGAQKINPSAEATLVDANTFDDAAKGKEIALSLYANGVDVILGDAGTTTLGIIEAGVAQQKYVIGDAIDHSSFGPGTVIMDTELGFGNSVYDIVRLYVNGELNGGVEYANYANGGIGTIKNKSFAENCADEALAARMDEIWAQVDEVESQIMSGDLVIEKDTSK